MTDLNPLPSRRGFLVGMAGATLMFGFARSGATAETVQSAFQPTIWYGIDRDGIVTVNIIRAEMGQHIGTALARIRADELEADWGKVRIVEVDSDPRWGYMVTGGSWSVWMTFPVFSRAGAAGRTALIEAGAKLLGVPADQCTARSGAVSAGSRSVAYGEIVVRGDLKRSFTADELAKMPIKLASERRLIGHATDALDIPAKTNGTARYGIDASVDGMVYARPKIPPTRNGSRVRSIDDAAAKTVKGYIASLALEDPSDTVPGWVMVPHQRIAILRRLAALMEGRRGNLGVQSSAEPDRACRSGTRVSRPPRDARGGAEGRRSASARDRNRPADPSARSRSGFGLDRGCRCRRRQTDRRRTLERYDSPPHKSPFAGRRQSGYGIGGIPWTMNEFTERKMIVFRT